METLNPIQRKIAGGMSAISAFLSEATCSDACWYAKDDICHCSCGGKNHGCMRSSDGVQPKRTAKIDGYRYQLAAAGYDDIFDQAVKFNEAHGVTFIYACTSRDISDRRCPAKIRYATESQVEKWPELAAYRANIAETWRKENPEGTVRDWPGMPRLLWIREDLA